MYIIKKVLGKKNIFRHPVSLVHDTKSWAENIHKHFHVIKKTKDRICEESKHNVLLIPKL